MSRPHLKRAGLDTRFEALSLLYGPPNKKWAEVVHPWYFTTKVPDAVRFKDAVSKCFSAGEIDRVGTHRIAHDYQEWYAQQEQSDETHVG